MSDSQTANIKDVQQHTRVVESLLGTLEKRALLWLAARMPAWVVPDTLTAVGLFASVLIFLGYALTTYHSGFLWLASFGFVLNWFGDSLDGNLARYRKIERPRYGFFIDHIIDTVSEGLVFIGLGLSPYLRFDLALIALVSYLWIATYVYLANYVNGVFRISYARMGPTEARILAVLANTVVFFIGNRVTQISFARYSFTLTFYDIVVVIFSALALILFFYNTMNTAMILSREDRIAAAARRRAARADRITARQEKRAAKKAATPRLLLDRSAQRPGEKRG